MVPSLYAFLSVMRTRPSVCRSSRSLHEDLALRWGELRERTVGREDRINESEPRHAERVLADGDAGVLHAITNGEVRKVANHSKG